MLYVLILYCSGICPDNLPAPNGALLFTSLKDCHTALANIASGKRLIVDSNGKPLLHLHQKQTCASLWADPKQLDRLYHLPLPQE